MSSSIAPDFVSHASRRSRGNSGLRKSQSSTRCLVPDEFVNKSSLARGVYLSRVARSVEVEGCVGRVNFYNEGLVEVGKHIKKHRPRCVNRTRVAAEV
jgi:hypothetical protein